ncbi:hypothetical protein P7C70_g8922, partial [Phenoliferia sp. Uapishka_3]
MIRSRSIGRNVIISGIEFEPTDSTPGTPALQLSGENSLFARPPSWLTPVAEGLTGVETVSTPFLEKSEDVMDFFAAVRSPTKSMFESPQHQLDGALVGSDDEVVRSVEPERVDSSGGLIMLPPMSEWGQVESSMDGTPEESDDEGAEGDEEDHEENPEEDPELSRSPSFWQANRKVSSLYAVPESDEADESEQTPEDDSPEAREARWAAFVAKADRGDSSPSPPPEAADSIAPPLPPSSISESPVSVELPSPAPTPELEQKPGSTFFERFGLGTIGRGAPSGTLSRSQSFSATTRAKGKTAVEDWILQGVGEGNDGGRDEEDASMQTFNIESGPAWKNDAPTFTVHVHSPEKRSSIGKADYTIFYLTTVFSASDAASSSSADGNDTTTDLRNLFLHPKPSSVTLDSNAFFSRVYHPEFNVDYAEAEDTVDRFERHVKAVEDGGGVRDIDFAIGKVREGLRGLALPPISNSETTEEDVEELANEGAAERDRRRALTFGLQNADGALTWKDACDESLSTTKAVQATAEAIGGVADLYDANARSTMLLIHELARESTYPYSQHASLIDMHRKALLQLDALTRSRPTDEGDPETTVHEDAVSRCETVLNITSAELERAHGERAEDLRTMAECYLDGEIAFHEQVISFPDSASLRDFVLT